MTKNIFLLIAGIASTVAGLLLAVFGVMTVIDVIIPYIQYYIQNALFDFIMFAVNLICILGILFSGISLIIGSMKGESKSAATNIVFIIISLTLTVIRIILNGGFSGTIDIKNFIPELVFAGVLVLDIIGLSVGKKAA